MVAYQYVLLPNIFLQLYQDEHKRLRTKCLFFTMVALLTTVLFFFFTVWNRRCFKTLEGVGSNLFYHILSPSWRIENSKVDFSTWIVSVICKMFPPTFSRVLHSLLFIKECSVKWWRFLIWWLHRCIYWRRPWASTLLQVQVCMSQKQLENGAREFVRHIKTALSNCSTCSQVCQLEYRMVGINFVELSVQSSKASLDGM